MGVRMAIQDMHVRARMRMHSHAEVCTHGASGRSSRVGLLSGGAVLRWPDTKLGDGGAAVLPRSGAATQHGSLETAHRSKAEADGLAMQ